jgi:hypothetical protein
MLGLAPPSRTFPLSAVAAETTRTGKLGLAPPNRTFPESSLAASDGRTGSVEFRTFFLWPCISLSSLHRAAIGVDDRH